MEKKRSLVDWILIVGFIFYVCFLLGVILFKYVSPLELFIENRYLSRTINFMPFNDIINGYFNKMDIVGNMILFIPMGIYFSVFFKKDKAYFNIFRIALISLGFEVAQYILAIGASDITDIITNSIGGVIGIVIYLFIKMLFKTDIKRKKFIAICSTLLMGIVGFVLIGITIYN